MKKRILALLLTLSMVLSVVSTTAFAADGTGAEVPQAETAAESIFAEIVEVEAAEESVDEEEPQAEAVEESVDAEEPQAEAVEESVDAEEPQAEAVEESVDAEEPQAEAAEEGVDAEEPQTEAVEESVDAEEPQAEAAEEGVDAEEPQTEAVEVGVDAEEPQTEAVEESVNAEVQPIDASIVDIDAELPLKETAEEINKAEEPQTDAAKAGTLTVLAFSSDVHNKSGNVSANRLGTWLTKIIGIYGGIDVMAFGGDMADASASASNYWTLTQADLDVLTGKEVSSVVTTGNHEHSPGNYSASSTNETQKVYKINTQGVEGENYRIYCLGSVSSSASYSSQVSSLTSYLNSVGNDKPIFIITHFPLHYAPRGAYSERKTTDADKVIDALNTAVAENGQKIVFLWGHNHTESDTHYDQIYKPGDSISYTSNASTSTKTIQFYYGAAGCMSDSEYGAGSAYVKGKGLVVTINSKNQLSFTYYDANANDVTEGGTFTEQDPVAVEGISIDEATPDGESGVPAVGEDGEPLIGNDGQPVLVDKTVEKGRAIKLHVTVEPADATNKTVTWSSSDTNIARVDTSGTVRGISVGVATITATINDTAKRAVFQASIDVAVTPRTTQEQYYVITITKNNVTYALSSHAYDGIMSNSSGYEYHGLEAVVYSADDPAPYYILWTLEPVDDSENCYYIKSYNGKYLNSTYVSNGTGYTGTLFTGDTTDDSWTANSGIDGWLADGSTLQSTNSSTSSKAMYLGVTTSNNEVEFFTVRSTSDSSVPRTSILIEPAAILEPVAVTGITLDPATLTVEVGKTIAVTANVLPANADDKTVTWTSSDESIATVSNAGRVKGIAVGTATITATTNDGGFSASCAVEVAPSAAPGIGYVITIDGYALSVNASSDVLVNSTNYRYEGLTGVSYDENTELTNDILWLIEPTEGGYYIMSQDGQYLNAYYNATTNPTGCDAALKVDDTPDVWTFEGSLEDWMISGSTLHSANADKYMTHEEGSTSAPLNLFTVRSTGESSSMIDPDNPGEVRFVETSSLSSGKDYIVAVTKDGSSVYAIENVSGSSSGNTGSATLTVNPASGDEAAYIVTVNTGVVWNYTSNNYLSNNSRYLSRSTNNPIVPRTSQTGRAVTYSSSNKRLSLSYSGTYYLTNSSGTFGFSTSSSSAAQVRLFVKQTVFNFKYVVQFVSNGVNYYSAKYAEGEAPVYSGVTPTREETELYTYTFSGWSSDGGTTIYGPNDALPAVTGPVTYVAQFTAVPKEEHEHTYGEPSYEWAEDNSSCTAAVVCTSCTEGTEGHTLTETVEPAEAVVTAPACETAGEKRLTATFENELFESQTKTVVIPAKGHNWDYENIVWKWTALRGGYSAEATLTCKDCGETETIPADVTETESGVYTATITDPDGNQYHDTKTEIQAGTITITASKTEVRVGDTVTFTITMGPVENLSSMQMKLDLPEGLTFKSGDFSDAFKEAIVAIEGISSFDDALFTFASADKMFISGFIGISENSQYTNTEGTVIGTFTCEVTSAFSGTKIVGLTEDDLEFRTLDEEEIPMEAFGVDITLNNVFTITFVNEDGTTLDTQTVEYGETPEYGGETPTKQATAQYSYSFAGWDPEIVPAVADATYTATYTETVNKYTVKFVDEDGETVLLAAAEYNYGTPAADIVTPADPTKEATAQYSYSFAGWDPEITEVTADVTYRATYTSTVNKYTVTFVDEDGETVLLEAAEYDYGTAAADIVKPADPTKEATAQYTFTFAGWDPELADVTADVTYKATYTSTVNEYTITFVNYDGSVLQTGKVKYGETPVYSGETPTRPATAEFTYTFTGGWDPAITAVTGDATYTAVYTTAINTYGVSGTVESFTIEALDGVTYGNGTVTLTLVPAVESEDPITVTAAEDGTYSFQAVPVGTYELQVSKADHATRNYTVEVVDKAVTQDVKIQLLGDINGDGKVAAIDLALINWYVTGVKEPDDPYKKACADVNMDGEISTVEIGYINSHVKKASIIWAVIKNAQP